MGRLLEGFGVGIISYTVCNRRFLACLFPAKNFVFQNYGTSAVVSVRGKKETKDQVGFQYCGAKVNHD
jgi:hypothetical protein